MLVGESANQKHEVVFMSVYECLSEEDQINIDVEIMVLEIALVNEDDIQIEMLVD